MNLALIPGLPSIGATEMIVVLTIILLLFGARRIPELARGLGSGVREFKGGISGSSEKKRGANETAERPEGETVRAGR